jgi:hypothetical protein
MKEMIGIMVSKDKRTKMIQMARREIDAALSGTEPLFNDQKDELRLREYVRGSDGIKLTYEILRNRKELVHRAEEEGELVG